MDSSRVVHCRVKMDRNQTWMDILLCSFQKKYLTYTVKCHHWFWSDELVMLLTHRPAITAYSMIVQQIFKHINSFIMKDSLETKYLTVRKMQTQICLCQSTDLYMYMFSFKEGVWCLSRVDIYIYLYPFIFIGSVFHM